MSTMDHFRSFFSGYASAMLEGDEAALRQTLPQNADDDHVAFLLQFNRMFFAQAVEEGADPELRQDGDCFVARYSMSGEDGVETMDREFWWHDDRWVSFDPSEQ